jgi:hypothetical protein
MLETLRGVEFRASVNRLPGYQADEVETGRVSELRSVFPMLSQRPKRKPRAA